MTEQTKGTCPHGEFILMDGCPECTARRAEGLDGLQALEQKLPKTAMVKVRPQSYENIQALLAEVNTIAISAESLVVNSELSVKEATSDLNNIATKLKMVNAARNDFLDPLQQYITDVKADFKLIIDPLGEANQILRGKVLTYRKEEQRKVDEANAIERQKREIAEREAALNNETLPIQPPVAQKVDVPTHTKTEVGSTSMRGVAKWQVIDLSLVPREYLMIDAGKVGKVVKASHGSIVIPGIEIKIEPSLIVQGGRQD